MFRYDPVSRSRMSMLVAILASVAVHGAPPEAIYFNARFRTLDPAKPMAQAVAVERGRIVAVGGDDEVRALAGPDTRLVDLGGGHGLPGLIDAHGHVASLGLFGLGRIDLSGARSFDEVVATVAARVKSTPKGEWIVGGRWDHESWPDRTLPTHAKLSAVSPDHPVWLTRVDGHAGLANAAAMKLAGVTRETPSPAGGEILRDAAGEPTGIFVDNAEDLIAATAPRAAEPAAAIRRAQEMCLSVGLTGVHDMGVSPADVEVYKQLVESGELKLRIYAAIHGQVAMAYFAAHRPLIGERLTVRACKLYADGAMGSRGAWLLEPYADRPQDADGKPYTGLAVMRPEFLRQVAADAATKGYQVCTHAIGDRGNREALDAYEAGLAASARARNGARFRIEHAQLLSPEDIPRFARLGVIASMQPTHCTSDMRWVNDRVGPQRARGAYAWASLLKSGARIAGGSDFPVESHNPFLGIYAAVTRQDADGKPDGGWNPQERMTREQALRAFTLDAAYAAFEEDVKGSLEVGKYADFIVLDRDVMTCAAGDIPGTTILRTVIGGEVVYARP